MRSFVFIFLLALLALPLAGHADYIVWRDAPTGLTLSVPDSWQIQTNQRSDDLFTAMAPSGRGHAMCRVRAGEDGRYLIYPPQFNQAIQKISYSTDFWKKYFASYDGARISGVRDGAGLGRNYASYVIADYESAVPGPYMPRRALAFASLYNGDVFILECSAHKDAFGAWKTMFLSIAGSVDFKPAYHQSLSGHYRNFLNDPAVTFEGEEGKNITLY